MWVKSTYSAENGCCVEVATGPAAQVRDSKDIDEEGANVSAVLTFDAGSWRQFLGWLRG